MADFYCTRNASGGLVMTPRKTALTLIYRHAHRDQKGTTDGTRTILAYRNGTCLVALDALTDAEVRERLPYALKLEGRRQAKLAARKRAADDRPPCWINATTCE